MYNTLKILILLFSALSLTNGNTVSGPNFIEYFATLTASEIAQIPKTIIEDSLLDTVSNICLSISKALKIQFLTYVV